MENTEDENTSIQSLNIFQLNIFQYLNHSKFTDCRLWIEKQEKSFLPEIFHILQWREKIYILDILYKLLIQHKETYKILNIIQINNINHIILLLKQIQEIYFRYANQSILNWGVFSIQQLVSNLMEKRISLVGKIIENIKEFYQNMENTTMNVNITNEIEKIYFLLSQEKLSFEVFDYLYLLLNQLCENLLVLVDNWNIEVSYQCCELIYNHFKVISLYSVDMWLCDIGFYNSIDLFHEKGYESIEVMELISKELKLFDSNPSRYDAIRIELDAIGLKSGETRQLQIYLQYLDQDVVNYYLKRHEANGLCLSQMVKKYSDKLKQLTNQIKEKAIQKNVLFDVYCQQVYQLIESNDLNGLKQFEVEIKDQVKYENLINSHNHLQDRKTPLMIATQIQSLEMINYLLQFTIIVNDVDIHGNTALMLACQYNNLTILELLLSKRANVNYKNEVS